MILSNAIDDAWYDGNRVGRQDGEKIGEQRGEKRGIQYSILRNLSNKFGKEQIDGIKDLLSSINDIDNLNLLLDYSISLESPSVFIAKIADLKLKENS